MTDSPKTSMPPHLRAWLQEQPEATSADLERAWDLTGLAGPPPVDHAPVDAAWARLDEALEQPASPPADISGNRSYRHEDRRGHHAARGGRPPIALHRRRTIAWGAAASVVVLIGLALYLYQLPVTVVAPPGALASVELPDGSEVRLNSDSRISYRRGWAGWDRTVRLRGEAFFDVAAAREIFTVKTFNAQVEVLGTRFNVRARPDDAIPATVVVLAEGRVRLRGEGAPNDPVTLNPGQMSRVANAGGASTLPEPADVSAAIAWRTGALAFNRQPLGAILDELARRFDVLIRTHPNTLRRDTLSLYLPRPVSAPAVLRDICAYRGYACQLEGDTLIIGNT